MTKTILLLISSNFFMTFAWYGFLKDRGIPLWKAILVSWGIAFFEYLLMVPANRLGSKETGGNLDLFQLKILQEVIGILVFAVVVLFLFKGETIQWKHALAFCFILAAVWLVY